MRRRTLSMLAVAACGVLLAGPGSLATPAAAVPEQCRFSYGDPLSVEPWPQRTLRFDEVAQFGQGRYLTAGRTSSGRPVVAGQRVTIAVIDSGFDPRNPVLRRAHVTPERHEIAAIPNVYDCAGHGTQVASVIAAQPNVTPLTGIAPQARILPIVYTNSEDGPQAPVLARSLAYAISHHVQVINLSLQATATTAAVEDELRAAARAGIVVVAAGGNEESGKHGPFFPASLSTRFPNVIAVGAVGENGAASSFNYGGDYIDVAAPGENVPVADRVKGVSFQNGTSFAAPFVSGLVALLLGEHPGMTPAQIRNRLETTADPPPGAIPNSQYGYGTIDPLLALTSAQDDSVPAPSRTPHAQIAAPRPTVEAGRTLQHRALAVAVVLLGLAVLVVTGAAVLRGRRPGRA